MITRPGLLIHHFSVAKNHFSSASLSDCITFTKLHQNSAQGLFHG